MANYLLVLIDVDESPDLVAAGRELSEADPESEFVLLAPATPVPPLDLLFDPRCTSMSFARRRAQRVQAQLLASGIHLRATRLGNFDPLRAVEDALRYASYSAIVVAAPRHAFLHIIHSDVADRLARRFPQVRVISVGGVRFEPGSGSVSAETTRSRSPRFRF